MRIISKRGIKDYYDYLQGTYGIDPLVIYDRRECNVIDPPKKEEISDVIQWNKKHGIIWLTYGICIELGFWLGFVMPVEVLEMVFMMGGVIIPLPFMVIRHRKLEKEYKLK